MLVDDIAGLSVEGLLVSLDFDGPAPGGVAENRAGWAGLPTCTSNVKYGDACSAAADAPPAAP